MIDSEAVYLKLPVPLQHATCSLQGWAIQRNRFGPRFGDLLRAAESRTFWSPEQLAAYRDGRLRSFVQYCARTVPFYHTWFRDSGVDPNDIRGMVDLQRLPVLTKDIVREHSDHLVSTQVPRRGLVPAHTSGTTGGGLRFSTTMRSVQEQWATWWRYRRWHGLQPGTWCGYFGGRSVVPLSQTRPPFWRYNVPGRQILFSGYHMSAANLGAYVEELKHRRPPWLHGYPSQLASLAAYVLAYGTDLGYELRWITIGAENLLIHQADLIERAFGTRPRQHYGMAEAVANISECEHGSLHVDEDFAAVEFVPAPHGPGYKILGSNFTNLAMPLLRYDVQDLATLSDTPCGCGRPGRIVASVDGRQEDYVVLRNGARLGRMDHIFKDMTNIREAQILQRKPGDIIIRVARAAGYTVFHESLLLREIRKRVGDDTRIHIDYVDSVERSGTGKLRFVLSEIPDGQLHGVIGKQRCY